MQCLVVYGSVRSARQGIAVAHFAVEQLERRGHGVHLFDPLELGLPLLDKMYKEYAPGQAPARLEAMADPDSQQ